MTDSAVIRAVFAVPLTTTATLLVLFGVYLHDLTTLTDLFAISTVIDAHALVFGLIYKMEYFLGVTLVRETHVEDIETVILIIRILFCVMGGWLGIITIAGFFNEDAVTEFFDFDVEDGIAGVFHFLVFKVFVVFGPWIALPFVALWQIARALF